MLPNDPFNYNPPQTARGFQTGQTDLERPRTNGLGIAGFVLSLLGLGCGCLSIFGVILSAIAMRRRPRGFAIAGLIIGLAGLLFMILVIILLAAFGAFSVIPATIDGYKVNDAIQAYQQTHNGASPPTWAEVPGMSGGLNDAWGRPYLYTLRPDGKTVELVSDGRDGLPGTADDLTVEIENDFVTADMGPVPASRRGK